MEERTRSRTTAKSDQICTYTGRRYSGTAANPTKYTELSATKAWKSGTGGTELMQDVVIPDYHLRSAQGEIFNNPLYRELIQEIDPKPAPYYRGMLRYGTVSGVKVLLGDVWNSYLPISPGDLGVFLSPGLDSEYVAMVEALKNKAVTDAHAKCNSDEMNVWATAGEGRETVESIASILMRAYKICRAVRKADVRYLKRELTFKELSSRYMEARYALRPLVYDAVGVCEAWNKSTTNGHQRQTFRGYASDVYEVSDTFTSNSWWQATRTVKRTGAITVHARAGVLTDVEVSKLAVWGADAIIDAGWELLPFSFIVDWFWNVGKTVSSWMPRMGVRKLTSWVTVKSVATMINELESVSNLPNVPAWDADSAFYWSGVKTRLETRVTRIPNPSREIMPHLNVRLDNLKLLDLTLIFKQTFGKGFLK